MNVPIKINNMDVTAVSGQSLLEVIRRAGFKVPSLCHHEALPAIGACRICLVEVHSGGKSQLTTSCNFKVETPIEVITDSALISKHRAMNLELLMARAPSSPKLREIGIPLGIPGSRFATVEDPYLPNCILCELCVRVCAQLGHNALNTIGRGEKKRIGLPFHKPADSCVGCGSCTSVCPTQCISMKDTATTRTIWGRTFNMVLCKNCAAPVITHEHRSFAIATLHLPEDYYDLCESCKQAATSKRFAAIAW